MIMTESALRHIIRYTILLEQDQQEEALMDKVDDKIDNGLASIDSKLQSLMGDIEDIDPDEQPAGDEAIFGAALGMAGLGLAIPLALKAIGLIARVFGETLEAFESLVTDGMVNDMDDLGEEWQEWWFQKAEDLQKTYKKWMDKLSTKLLGAAGVDPIEPKHVERVSKVLWAILYASIGVSGGITAWKAWKDASYLYSGFKGITSALKEKDAAVYLYDVIVSIAEGAAL